MRGAIDSTPFDLKSPLMSRSSQSTSQSRQDLTTAVRCYVYSSAMSNSNQITYTCAAVLVIILVFPLLNDPVIGKPLMLEFQEEEPPNFQYTDRDGTHLMEEYDMFDR